MSLKHDPMGWSSQIETSCRRLLQSNISGDKVLVALANISKVSMNAANMIRRLSEEPDYAIHVIFQIQTLRTMLDQVQTAMGAEQLQHSQSPSSCVALRQAHNSLQDWSSVTLTVLRS